MEELSDEIKELKTESKELKLETKEVVDLQKIEEELKTQIKGVEAENEVLKEKNGAMEKQVVDLQKMEEVFKTKVKEVEAENEMLSKRNEKVVHLQKREEELKEEIKELKTESKELKLESREVKKEIREVEAEKEVMRKRNEVTEKKVGDLQKIEEELKIEIKELKTELRELKKEIKEVEAKNEVLRNRNEIMEKKVADLQRMEEEPKTKIKGEEAENKVLIREKSEATEITSKIIGEGGIPRGPWGGNVGAYWAYKSDIAPIMQITLRYGSVIDSISIKSKSCEGNVIGSFQRFGGPYGHNSVTFRIDSSIEQLSSISLTYGHFNGERTITSLCFYSNRDTYGPFGSVQDPDDPPVSIPIEDDVVLAGFHGRAGNYLNAIGIFIAPKVLNSSHKASGSMLRLEEIK